MKTYFADIIPKIQKFSQKLDSLTLLTNQHWVLINDIDNIKQVYIFRKNNELLISQNGKVEKAKWEYLGNNSLLIDRKEDSYLFKHGFFDKNILALKIDSSNEYAFFVNETKFDRELNSLRNVIEFLEKTYLVPPIPIKKSLPTNVIAEDIRVDIIGYKAPEYEIRGILEKNVLLEGRHKVYEIDFIDGLYGEIYVQNKSKKAFFTVKKFPINAKYYFETFDHAINALHYFRKNGKVLKEGAY